MIIKFNPFFKPLLIILFIIFVIFTLGKMTGFLAYFRMSSVSSEPNIKNGSIVFSSNLIKPKRLDFIIYKSPKLDSLTFKITNNESEPEVLSHRLCGVENDTIEIIDGNLFVNSKNIDKHLNIKRPYIITNYKLNKLKEELDINKNDFYKLKSDSIKIFLPENIAEKKYHFKRFIRKKQSRNISDIYKKLWNEDNFGPLIIKKGFVFVLGDNRGNSFDSRNIGLIEEKNIKGVILFK